MNPFINKQCRDYSKQESALNLSQIEENRRHTPEWQYWAPENHLERVYRFKSYTSTIEFVNKVANIADQQNHHPNMLVSYNRCKVSFITHTVNGLTENDFICAAKIDALESI
ncbi:MAG: 4a-hydroxytetrahydrobiopterin dehydratase [Acidiferrobacterales bacterium]|nr:4a-hydroxytetrahydrobiopterin dehydratase [Acidiferrobacterales bacterium]